MPELPEVENFTKYFKKTSLNKKIKNIEVNSSKVLKGLSSRSLQQRFKGKKFSSVGRHAKYMFAKVSKDETLVFHFGMTGFFKYYKNEDEKPSHPRIIFQFANGYNLAYDCQRMFGKIYFTKKAEDFIKEKDLGVDPLAGEFSLKKFKEIIDKSPGTLKSFLMDQSKIGGIGNVYSDEILFQAGFHPSSSVKKLSEDQAKKLFKEIKPVLSAAIKADTGWKNFPKKFLTKIRGDDNKCPKCGGTIDKKKIAGRTSYFCKKHQIKI